MGIMDEGNRLTQVTLKLNPGDARNYVMPDTIIKSNRIYG